MTEIALHCVAAEERPELRSYLDAIGDAVQPLKALAQPISGDPNPLNWGLRADNQVVLFDWERVGFGPPAFDLAITIPGLAQQADAQLVAQAYLTTAGTLERHPTRVQTLAQDILRCKVWVIVEFMATVVERELSLPPAYQTFLRTVPDWVAQLASNHGSRIRHNCPEEPQRPSSCW
jgi:Ser/Thr protein kinase RdoA (MazF antagonist)